MTEIKEKLISKIYDGIMRGMDDCHILSLIAREADIDELKLIIRDVLREELGDVVVIDRKKLKDKLSVVMYDDGLKSIYFKTGVLCRKECDRMEFFTGSADVKQMKDYIKEEFIAHLEECDFE